jgi:hypothetical protein
MKEIIGKYSDVKLSPLFNPSETKSENRIPAYNPKNNARKVKSSITNPFLNPFHPAYIINSTIIKSRKFIYCSISLVHLQSDDNFVVNFNSTSDHNLETPSSPACKSPQTTFSASIPTIAFHEETSITAE